MSRMTGLIAIVIALIVGWLSSSIIRPSIDVCDVFPCGRMHGKLTTTVNGTGPSITVPASLSGNWIQASFPQMILWRHPSYGGVIQLDPRFLKLGYPEKGRERILVLQNYYANGMTRAKMALATTQVDFLNSAGAVVGTGEWAIQPRCGGPTPFYNFVDLTGPASSITQVRIKGKGGQWINNSLQCF
jgi:hypothetical protein